MSATIQIFECHGAVAAVGDILIMLNHAAKTRRSAPQPIHDSAQDPVAAIPLGIDDESEAAPFRMTARHDRESPLFPRFKWAVTSATLALV